MTRATNDVENVAEMFSAGLVLLVTDLLKMAGFAIVLFWSSARSRSLTFPVVPFLALAAFVFRLKVRDAFRATRVLLARINATIQETVTGMKVVQLFTREERNLRDFARLNAEHRDAWLYVDPLRLGALLGGRARAGHHDRDRALGGHRGSHAGTIYLFIDCMRRFFLPLADLSAKYSVMQSSMASVERIFQLLDTSPRSPTRRPTLRGAPVAGAGPGARSSSRTSGSPTRARTGCCATSRSASRRASASPSWARRAPARPR